MSTITIEHPDLGRPFPVKPRPVPGKEGPQAYFLQTSTEEDAEVVILQPNGAQESLTLEEFHAQYVPNAQGARGTRIRQAIRSIFAQEEDSTGGAG